MFTHLIGTTRVPSQTSIGTWTLSHLHFALATSGVAVLGLSLLIMTIVFFKQYRKTYVLLIFSHTHTNFIHTSLPDDYIGSQNVKNDNVQAYASIINYTLACNVVQ